MVNSLRRLDPRFYRGDARPAEASSSVVLKDVVAGLVEVIGDMARYGPPGCIPSDYSGAKGAYGDITGHVAKTAMLNGAELDWDAFRDDLIRFELPAGVQPQVAPAVDANDVIPDRTGLAGRPTSWHLIEAECRQRYEARERHPGKAGESRAEWARVLIGWLGAEHPSAAVPQVKTLTNKLGKLLRELVAGAPSPTC